jgi:hypothetical protein
LKGEPLEPERYSQLELNDVNSSKKFDPTANASGVTKSCKGIILAVIKIITANARNFFNKKTPF